MKVRRLLCSSRPVAIQMSINPSASDQEVQQVCTMACNNSDFFLFFFSGSLFELPYSADILPLLFLIGKAMEPCSEDYCFTFRPWCFYIVYYLYSLNRGIRVI